MTKKTKKIKVTTEIDQAQSLKREALADELMAIAELVSKKSSEYGDDDITTFGEQGLFIRIADRLSQLKPWMWHQAGYLSDDTLDSIQRELAAYTIISILLRKKSW